MMMTSVDWKRDGFDAGSRTDALDWKDWKRPVISRPNAKLLRKRTYWVSDRCILQMPPTRRTRLEIAALNKTRSVSS
jgi:hypothetical protein